MTKLCFPISNAFVEGVFSQATLVKTKVRNKIGYKLLNSILMVRSHLMMNNSCCKNFHVSGEMLSKFNVTMYNNPRENPEGEEVSEDEEALLQVLSQSL